MDGCVQEDIAQTNFQVNYIQLILLVKTCFMLFFRLIDYLFIKVKFILPFKAITKFIFFLFKFICAF